MIGGPDFFIAFRYLRAKRQEGFISVIAWFSLLGIMLGVATLIIVMAVMNGFRHELLSRVIGLGGHITITDAARNIADYPDAIATIAGLDGVVAAVPLVEGQVMISAEKGAAGALVRGITAQDFLNRPILRDSLVAGDIAPFRENRGVIIGERLAARLGVGVGDNLTLISPRGTVTAFGAVPRVKSYEIVGLFNVGMYEYDNGYLYMPFAAAQTFFRKPGAATQLEVMVADAERSRAIAAQIRARLQNGAWRVLDWRTVNGSFFNALQVERNVMFLILTLIILVAAFNVVSSQIMLVKDKGRGIAILRSMGASRGLILRVFFITGSSVGVIGTAFGAALGIGFARNIEAIRQGIQALSGADLFAAEIYFLSQLPARIEMTEVGAVVLMALGLSFLASIYPAWRAARLDPVEVLRYE